MILPIIPSIPLHKYVGFSQYFRRFFRLHQYLQQPDSRSALLGISTGFIWNTTVTSMKNTTIKKNYIHHISLKLNDSGGIYVLGNQPNSVVSNNAMTDIYPPSPGSAVAGLYFDNGSSGWKVQENSTSNWFCSDCQPNHVPSDSPTNFNLVSNNVYGSVPPVIDLTKIGPQTTPPTQTPTPTPKGTSLPRDIDKNGKVDIFDYNLLFSDFGKTGKPGFVPSDINRDGKVDILDYNILIANFGK